MPSDFCIGEDTDTPSLALDIGNIKNFGVLSRQILLTNMNFQCAKFFAEFHQGGFVKLLVSE